MTRSKSSRIELDKKSKNRIIGVIRQAFRYSDQHKEAKRRARVEKKEGYYKNGREKVRVYYCCAICNDLFKPSDIDIDHRNPLGKFTGDFNDWIDRLFCSVDNLQAVCKPCHKKKTKNERKA